MAHPRRFMRWQGPPLALRNLIYSKSRLVVALGAISFAITMIFMQFGLVLAVLNGAKLIYNQLDFEILLISTQSLEATYTQPFERQHLIRAAGVDGVASAKPCYVGFTSWQNPVTKFKRPIFLLAANPADQIFSLPIVYKYTSELKRQDTVLLNRLSRPEYGPIRVGLKTELGQRQIEVVGLFSMSTTFRADASAIVSDQNFIRLNPSRSLNQVNLGIIKVKPQENIQKVIQHLRQLMPATVEVLSRAEVETKDQTFWLRASLIGHVFSVGAMVSFAVGAVIVYQVLYTDVTEHLKEYGTLRAIGYSRWRLARVVLHESLILAVLGFIPSFFLGLGIYQIIFIVTKLPIQMSFRLAVFVFSLTLIMCVLAGLISIRKILTTDPADVF